LTSVGPWSSHGIRLLAVCPSLCWFFFISVLLKLSLCRRKSPSVRLLWECFALSLTAGSWINLHSSILKGSFMVSTIHELLLYQLGETFSTLKCFERRPVASLGKTHFKTQSLILNPTLNYFPSCETQVSYHFVTFLTIYRCTPLRLFNP
jgi:hypothetical protein